MTNVIPNAFIIGDELVFVNVSEMSPKVLGRIAESKAFCNKMERIFETNNTDEMMRKGIDAKALSLYLSHRHTLIEWGYTPEDWA